MNPVLSGSLKKACFGCQPGTSGGLESTVDSVASLESGRVGRLELEQGRRILESRFACGYISQMGLNVAY